VYERAEEDLSAAISFGECTADIAAFYAARASIYARWRKEGLAMADCNSALSFDEGNNEARAIRAALYLDEGDLTNANADCNAILSTSPDYALAYGLRGAAMAIEGDYTNALVCADRALELDPQTQIPHAVRGLVYERLGLHDKAIEELTNALRGNSEEYLPALPTEYFLRGEAFYNKGMYAEASADYLEAALLEPENVDAYYNLALTSYLAGRSDFAMIAIRQVLLLKPKYRGAWELMLRILNGPME
jgi:tetratricopeptide (TPR) repeat protein